MHEAGFWSRVPMFDDKTIKMLRPKIIWVMLIGRQTTIVHSDNIFTPYPETKNHIDVRSLQHSFRWPTEIIFT